jgi:hypothetical protein
VRQLQKVGDAHTINRLKADIVQRAYEAATRGSADAFGNPVFVARRWEDALNSIGAPKLEAIFSPAERAHLSAVGIAARALNESVPGAANTSNSSSALVNALARTKQPGGPNVGNGLRVAGKAINGAAQLGATFAAPGKGNLMVAGAASMVGKAAKKAAETTSNAQLARAIRMTLDPEASRAADTLQANNSAQRRALAEAMGKFVPPAPAAIENRKPAVGR